MSTRVLHLVIPDPLARFGPDLSGVYTAQYPEPQILGHLDVGPDTNVQSGSRAPAAILFEQVKTGLRACQRLGHLLIGSSDGKMTALASPPDKSAAVGHEEAKQHMIRVLPVRGGDQSVFRLDKTLPPHARRATPGVPVILLQNHRNYQAEAL